MKHHPVIHPLAGITFYERTPQPSPILPFHVAIEELKGGASPWRGVVFVFTMTLFVEPQMSKDCDFPSLFKGFMMHYCAKPFEQAWKVTAFTCSWFWIYSVLKLKMSWKKESAATGLGRGGLTSREAAREALQLDCFQNMGDPLADPDPTLGPVIKQVSVDFI